MHMIEVIVIHVGSIGRLGNVAWYTVTLQLHKSRNVVAGETYAYIEARPWDVLVPARRRGRMSISHVISWSPPEEHDSYCLGRRPRVAYILSASALLACRVRDS